MLNGWTERSLLWLHGAADVHKVSIGTQVVNVMLHALDLS
jgi:hypothetical protein